MNEKKRSPLGIIFLTLFVDLVGFSIIFPLFPDMVEYYLVPDSGGEVEFHTVVLFGGILGSLYSLLQFLFAPVWGGLSDRIGRRPVLLLSIAGTAGGYVVWILSGNLTLLILSRVITGCMSGNISTASAAIADSTGAKDRAKGMGVIGVAFGLGFILGPALGSLFSRYDLLESFPEAGLESWGVNPFSVPALVALGLSVLNLLWVGLRFQETLSAESRGKARESRRPINPLILFRPIRIPGVSRANLSYFLFIAAFSGIEFTLTFFATESFDGYYTRENMYIIFVFVGLIIALVQGGVVRRMAPKYGERKLVIFGLAALIPAFCLICFSPPSKLLLFTGLGIMAVGSALATPCLTALASLYTPGDRQGEFLGIFRSLGALARALGPCLFAGIYWKFGPIVAYVSAAILLIVPTTLAARLPQPVKSEEGESTGVQPESSSGEAGTGP